LSMEASSGLSFFWGVVGGLRTILSSVLEWLFRKKGWFSLRLVRYVYWMFVHCTVLTCLPRVYGSFSRGLLTKVDDDAMRAPPPFYMSSFGSCVDLPRPALLSAIV
jgi:hypothetical protein